MPTGRSYWDRIATERLGRRRVVTTGVSLIGGLAALSAVGCGDSREKQQDVSSRIATPNDTSSKAVRGGIFQDSLSDDPSNLDPMTTANFAGGFWSALAYSRPLQEKFAPGGTQVSEFIGDLAESYEVADGGLRVIVKLRGDAKWDARAPTNGRPVDADDAVYSFRTMAAKSPAATRLANKVNPAAPIESVEKIDNRTFVYKLAFPYAPLVASLARIELTWIVPRESEDKFDPRHDVRGSGPWMLEKREPSVSFSWKRNPNWFEKSRPFMDGIQQWLIPEYNAYIAQFRSGKIWDGSRATPDDIISIARDLPETQIYRGDPTNIPNALIFQTAQGSPFLDARVRRAVSMAIDRDTYARFHSGQDRYEAAGIPLDLRAHSHLGAGWTGYWLDPKGSDLGEGGKYFKHDIAEAKKLLSAAGAENVQHKIAFTTRYIDEKYASVISEMLKEAGIQSTLELIDYQTVMLGAVLYTKGQWARYGTMSFTISSAGVDPASQLSLMWDTGSASTRANVNDADQSRIDATIRKALTELDSAKYVSLVQDAQKQLAMHQPGVSYFYSTSPLIPMAAGVNNYNAIRRSAEGTGLLHVWLDEAKRNA